MQEAWREVFADSSSNRHQSASALVADAEPWIQKFG